MEYIFIDSSKGKERILLLGDPSLLPFEVNELPLPEKRLSAIQREINENRDAQKILEEELAGLTVYRGILEQELISLGKSIKFEQVHASMAGDEEVVYVTGFVPVNRTGELKKRAKANGWGLTLDSPGEDDVVPTLLKNPGWISIIDPVFDFADTVPGYREYDISLWFLLFFSLFFAIIIGDAGYGLCILGFTLFARVKMKNAPSTPFILFTVLGLCTVIWGAMTGTWFGYEALSRHPIFSRMVVDKIASFPGKGAEKRSGNLLCFSALQSPLSISLLPGYLIL
jgi:V/A-type H+-transporting ATPase subunit I